MLIRQITGRSPKDKFIMDNTSRDTVWWSTQGVNDIPETRIMGLSERNCVSTYPTKSFMWLTYCSANRKRLKVRFVMEVAWQAHFVKHVYTPN